MKYLSLLVVLLLLSCKTNNSISQNPCNTDYLYKLENADTLNDRKIFLFLKNYNNTECDNNAEYCQWRNELLFLLLANHTNQFLSQLDRIPDKAKILDELASPVHDGIDITSVLDKVKTYDKYPETKQEVITALNTAMQKYKRTVRNTRFF
ncbi:hypothetical protein ABS768_13170 [Flavobacterium sp. ST-75]|uniref:Uncharacterized protein n=1 Tax=Flavobacterium rhizophilum TaxID=3163296 RepID=A0ABW8YEP4_9FLAO